jgi:hypothetical protein
VRPNHYSWQQTLSLGVSKRPALTNVLSGSNCIGIRWISKIVGIGAISKLHQGRPQRRGEARHD